MRRDPVQRWERLRFHNATGWFCEWRVCGKNRGRDEVRAATARLSAFATRRNIRMQCPRVAWGKHPIAPARIASVLYGQS